MSVFLVTPLANNADVVGAAIAEKLPKEDFYQLANNAGWLVLHRGTTIEVSAEIGITSTEPGVKAKLGNALVTPVTSYYGIGPTNMWEWLKSRFERQ